MTGDFSPFFSVVIPTYNRAGLLKRALESLVKQTYRNFEVLVCDDGSTDNTEEVVHSFSDKISVVYTRNENGVGPSRPRNIGIKKAAGDWICFLDSDDAWFPEKLEKVVPYTKDFDFIYHDVGIGNINEAGGQSIPGTTLKSPVLRNLLLANTITTSSVVVRKSILLQTSGFSEKYFVAEDYDLWLRIAEITDRFYRIPIVLGEYYSDASSLHYNGIKMYKGGIEVLNNFKHHQGYAEGIKARRLLFFPYLAIFHKQEAYKIVKSVVGFNLSFIAGIILLPVPTAVSRVFIRISTKWVLKKYAYLANTRSDKS